MKTESPKHEKQRDITKRLKEELVAAQRANTLLNTQLAAVKENLAHMQAECLRLNVHILDLERDKDVLAAMGPEKETKK